MHIAKSIIPISLATLCLAANSYAFAITDAVDLPQENVKNSVSYLAGGIGEDEANAMKSIESSYPLSLEFSEHTGHRNEFVADVDVSIQDDAGNKVLETSTTGPFLLVNVPDGNYTVKAEENGKTLVPHVSVATGKPERVILVW